ncbi:MAG: glycosyltransferase family 4 protein [Ignavibacteriaceae bacterium]
MKILICIPSLEKLGGISGFYKTAQKYFSVDYIFFIRSDQRKGIKKYFNGSLKFYFFIKKILNEQPSIIHINTSFGFNSIIRDSIYILLSKFLKIKVIVSFHGWIENLNVFSHWIAYILLKKVFFSVSCITVLSKEKKDFLLKLGYNKNIYIISTIIDDELFRYHNEQMILSKIDKINFNEVNILFLARIEMQKGIYEIIEAFKIILKENPKVKLNVAGDGSALSKVKNKTANEKINNINFLGYVEGKEKAEAFFKSNIYVLPSYTEGLPSSLLEAMGFGLPVLVTNVGGMSEIIIDEKSGYKIKIKDVNDIINKFNELCSDLNKFKEISKYNFLYAKNNFLASKVIKQLESIYYEQSKD